MSFRSQLFRTIMVFGQTCTGGETVVQQCQPQRTRPYTPRHNGKAERYNRILVEEFLYAGTWTSEQERSNALGVWNTHYNYHRPHGAAGGQPSAAMLDQRVTNVVASYS